MQAVISYFVFFLIAVGSIWLIFKSKLFSDRQVSRLFIFIAFIVKIIAADGVIFIYTHFYHDRIHTDIFKYYDDGLIYNKIMRNHPKDAVKMFFEDTKSNQQYFHDTYFGRMQFWAHKQGTPSFSKRNMIKINALLAFVSGGFYFTQVLLFLFLSFCGLWLIYKAIKQFFEGKERLLFIFIFLLPASLIWTSGILKENILIFGFGLFLSATFSDKKLIKKLVYFFLSALLFYWFRPYMLGLLLVALPFAYYKKIKNYWLFGILAAYSVVFIYLISSGFLLTHLINERALFLLRAKVSDAGSFMIPPALHNSFLSLLANIPFALNITFFYPLIWQIHSALAIIPALENLFFFVFLILSLFFLRKISKNEQRFLAFSVVFILISYITIGLACPIVGAVIRYKIFAFLLLFVLPLLFIDKNKIAQKFRHK